MFFQRFDWELVFRSLPLISWLLLCCDSVLGRRGVAYRKYIYRRLGHLAYHNVRSKGCHVMRSVHLFYVFSLATPSICDARSTSLFPAKTATTTTNWQTINTITNKTPTTTTTKHTNYNFKWRKVPLERSKLLTKMLNILSAFLSAVVVVVAVAINCCCCCCLICENLNNRLCRRFVHFFVNLIESLYVALRLRV